MVVTIPDLLVKYGANINIRDFFGWTPLHRTMKKKDVKLIQELLKHKPFTNIYDNSGKFITHIPHPRIIQK